MGVLLKFNDFLFLGGVEAVALNKFHTFNIYFKGFLKGHSGEHFLSG